MKTKLYKGLSDDERGEIEEIFSRSTRLRNRLVEVLEEEINSLREKMERYDVFDKENWELRHVDLLSQIKQTKKLQNLLK